MSSLTISLSMDIQVAAMSCIQGCNEHWGACIFLNYGFLWMSMRETSYHMVVLYFFKELPYCSTQWLYQFTFLLTGQEGSLFSSPSLAFIISTHFDNGHSDQYEVVPHYRFDFHFSKSVLLSISSSVSYGCLLWGNVYLDLQ